MNEFRTNPASAVQELKQFRSYFNNQGLI